MGRLVSEILRRPKSKRLSRIVTIKSPSTFRGSIRKLQEGGLTRKEKKALQLAKAAARLQLQRKNLSPKERREFTEIANTPLPKITTKHNPSKRSSAAKHRGTKNTNPMLDILLGKSGMKKQYKMPRLV